MAESFASSAIVRRRMQAQRERDTGPELSLRRALHARGHRYRVDVRPIPDFRRKADVVFTRAKVAVFVDGCFWHGCPEHGRREHAVNGWYWPAKIERNRRRDVETTAKLEAAGWSVVRVWEHVTVDEAIENVEAALRRSTLDPAVDEPHFAG
jgi:DNA mismatch endonuclease, patch repair protein